MKTDLEILDETLLRYRQTEDLSSQERLAILSNLEYYLHQVLQLKYLTCFSKILLFTQYDMVFVLENWQKTAGLVYQTETENY